MITEKLKRTASGAHLIEINYNNIVQVHQRVRAALQYTNFVRTEHAYNCRMVDYYIRTCCTLNTRLFIDNRDSKIS